MGYSFYNPSENKVFVARNDEFFENDFINLKASGSVEDLEIIQVEDTNPSVDTSLDHEEDDQEIDEPQSDLNPIRKSSRTRRAPDRMCLYMDAEEHELGDLGEPANYKAALLDSESKKWLDAMNVEMQSMKDNDTDMDGALYVFKARLVAKGFTQTYGVDYEETFSPVADIRAIRILIAIAAYYDYEIWQMDGCCIYSWNQDRTDSSKRLIGLNQSAYIEKILKRFYMENSKRGTIPMQEKLKLSKSQGASTPAEKQRMQNIPYASAIGSIMYAVRMYAVLIIGWLNELKKLSFEDRGEGSILTSCKNVRTSLEVASLPSGRSKTHPYLVEDEIENR
ncbi:retrotransposon protein, putative, ty1-copia subclass [Tanacetum coccineum]|uniref:Retrotransposon protein, putative, ty1-copia subclass n=1 Tax=Tanacetum coccineum TaxID=301880 RepID=A0ABQ5DL49_9ASTR